MNRPRRIAYLTGTRADFGLMAGTLRRLHADPRLAVSLLVTGMHLDAAYGMTVGEVEALGVPVAARIPVDVAGRSPQSMATAVGQAIVGLAGALAADRPDLLLLLGDRGEMLAGAVAALHLGIPVAHLHGGERSGTVDESLRHAITKLAHLHLVASNESRDRVVRMGEDPGQVYVVGAPSLDDIVGRPDPQRERVLQRLGLAPQARFALVLFHPVVQEQAEAAAQTRALLQATRSRLAARGIALVWLAPNADAGSAEILRALAADPAHPVTPITHLPRGDYLDALACAEVLVGNSSSGIIEAASFGVPVVNVGTRQRLRERNANTVDCEADEASIAAAVDRALGMGRLAPVNVYGDGQAGARIVELLATVPLPASLLDKVNAY
jgi:GDP/UDP-N,N'-diacetylbacillosamine 2-epimerase (hydrolysing)